MYSGVLFLSLSLYLIQETLTGALHNCDLEFNLVKDGKKVNITEACKTVPCLPKCCAEKKILFHDGARLYCENTSYLEIKYNSTNLEDYSSLAIYIKDFEQEANETRKKTNDFILVHYDDFVQCHPYSQEIPGVFLSYILEDGRLVLTARGQPSFTYELGRFCFENSLNITSGLPEVKFKLDNEGTFDWQDDDDKFRSLLSANGMMVSCVFMALVLVAYALLKELRNLAGLMLMAYVATFMAFFLLRIIHVYAVYANDKNSLDRTGCAVMTLLVYYALLSSFCWMNTMSFNIWWTLRTSRNNLTAKRRGILVKFAWYGLYGWGAPLLATAFVVLADHVDLPGVIKPNVFQLGGCFFGDGTHTFYVHIPMTVSLCTNIIMFLMTAFNIWRIRKAISSETRKSSKNNEARCLVYLKLSIVMGITWICDVHQNNHWVWYLPEVYNSLIGLFIFIIFVCKRKIFLRLCDRFSIDNKFVQNLRMRSINSSTQVTKIEHGQTRIGRTAGRRQEPDK